MTATIVEIYSSAWLSEKYFRVGIPGVSTISTQKIYERILEIQTLERGAGAHIGYGLSGFSKKDELTEQFSSAFEEFKLKGKSYFMFASAHGGADTDAHVYFTEGMCVICYFSYDYEMSETVFHYECYKHITGSEEWVLYKFYDNVQLFLIHSFLNGDCSPTDILIDTELFDESFDGGPQEEFLDTEESGENVEFEIIQMDSLLEFELSQLLNLDELLKNLYTFEVAPYVNIDDQMFRLLSGNSRSHNKVQTECVAYRGGEVRPFGFPQNLNSKWCDINIIFCKNPTGEIIIGVIDRTSRKTDTE